MASGWQMHGMVPGLRKRSWRIRPGFPFSASAMLRMSTASPTARALAGCARRSERRKHGCGTGATDRHRLRLWRIYRRWIASGWRMNWHPEGFRYRGRGNGRGDRSKSQHSYQEKALLFNLFDSLKEKKDILQFAKGLALYGIYRYIDICFINISFYGSYLATENRVSFLHFGINVGKSTF